MESREDFYFDDSDNPGSDDTIEKEEHYKWAIALEEETKDDAVIPEDDLLEQAEPEVAERLILKRDLRKAAIARMEAAARTQGDFEDVIDAWDKEDKNRERRERYHEVCRDNAEVPFEYNMSPDEIVIPAPIQSVYWQQMMKGEFLDVIFDCPYELQELICDSNISQILSELSEKHKALFYFMSFQKEYAEPYEWITTVFSDWAFTFVTSFLYYQDYDALEEAERNVYRKGMECFGGIAPTYHIELLDKPTIVWDFHSLMLAIQMMFSFMITDENSTLKLCKHCGKIFVASRSNVQFCSPQCKNQHNVYKCRAKKEEE